MEVNIISRENIKPSSLSSPLDNIHLKNPFKISLLDQITPATYGSAIFFYPLSNKCDNAKKLSTRLKASLSDTLTLFYPYSGRVKDNLYVHDFHEGVPFLEARANCQISDILNKPILSSLNQLLPCRPFHDETSNPNMPQVAFQLTEFDCGGIAIGECMSHKTVDATTCSAFLNTWAAATVRDMDSDNLIKHVTEHYGSHVPDLLEASSRFLCVDSLPRFYVSTYENVWFGQLGNYRTQRFVFDAEALVTLKAQARSERLEKASRVQALSGLIWKSAMEASRKASQSSTSNSSPVTHVIAQAVNIRRRREKQSGTAVGNLFLWAIAIHYDDCVGNELAGLVELVNESISEVNNDYMKSIQGDEAFDLVTKYLKQIEEIYSNEKPELFGFTSWVNMGFNDLNFGFGKPIWVAAFGEAGPTFTNLTVMMDAMDGSGIEAWITLEEKVLGILENDPEFLALASVNPPVPIVPSSSN